MHTSMEWLLLTAENEKLSSNMLEWRGCISLKFIQIPKTNIRFILYTAEKKYLKDAIPGCSWHWGISVCLWNSIKWNSTGTHTRLCEKHRIEFLILTSTANNSYGGGHTVGDQFLALIGLPTLHENAEYFYLFIFSMKSLEGQCSILWGLKGFSAVLWCSCQEVFPPASHMDGRHYCALRKWCIVNSLSGLFKWPMRGRSHIATV